MRLDQHFQIWLWSMWGSRHGGYVLTFPHPFWETSHLTDRCSWGNLCFYEQHPQIQPLNLGLRRPHPKKYTSRDPKQLRTDGQAQTCQQLVAFCASTRMNQNYAVVNPARVAWLHVCCWRASRFSTAQELRAGKRARERKCGCASARSHGQFRHTHPIQTHMCVYMWNTQMYTTETAHAARAEREREIYIYTHSPAGRAYTC